MKHKHCDDYIDDPAAPEVLRVFLARARSPAHGHMSTDPFPKLFADMNGQTVRVTMASRLGDVGVTTNLETEQGYDTRTYVSGLTNFRGEP